MKADADPLRSVLGLHVYNATKGHGSFLHFDLTSTPDMPAKAAWFCVYMCTWQICEAGTERAHSESPDGVIQSACEALNGRRIEALVLNEAVTADGVFHSARLHLDNGSSIRMDQYDGRAEDDPLFVVHLADGTSISYLTDGRLEREKA